ncbi:hypothetical protein Tco_0011824 [Tanacetum coccineum]
MNPRDHVNSISTTVETDTTPIRRIGSTRYAISAQQNSKMIFEPRQATIPFPSLLYDDCCDEKKGSYGLKDLDTYSIGTTLRNDSLPKKEKDPDRKVKHPKGIAENVLVGIGKFVFLVDFVILDMPEDVNVPLILRRPFLSTAHAKVDVSFNPLYGDYIELNDLNEPQELRRNRVDDLELTVEEGKIVNEPMVEIFKTRYEFIGGLDDYPSDCDFDRRIHIDYAYNLRFSCMIGFEYVHANFLPILPINVMSKKFYNTIMKDKIEFNGRNELGNFNNAPVFVGNFYVITDFTVVEDMDPYLDKGMGNVLVGEPFCKASCMEARRFDGIITICDGNDSVTYQMVRSNPRFKHLTNEKCNKIPPLLKMSEQDKMNEISHSYQKL